jgi:CBS-domain-containing membrane protein
MKKRNQTLRKKVFERDNFTCQKCKIQDKAAKILEAHHITPLVMNGSDNLANIITLCSDCHHFAPNNIKEFEEYMEEEMEGTLTLLMKIWKKLYQKKSDKVQKKLG